MVNVMFGKVIGKLVDVIMYSIYDVDEMLAKFMNSDADIANADVDLVFVLPPLSTKVMKVLEDKIKSEFCGEYEVSGNLMKTRRYARVKNVRITIRPQFKKTEKGVVPCVNITATYLYRDYFSESKSLNICLKDWQIKR